MPTFPLVRLMFGPLGVQTPMAVVSSLSTVILPVASLALVMLASAILAVVI